MRPIPGEGASGEAAGRPARAEAVGSGKAPGAGPSVGFRAYRPRPPLDRFVEAIWFATGGHTPERERILPNGVIELMFNFADPQRVVDAALPGGTATFHRSWLAGLQRGGLVIEASGVTEHLGIRFRPGGAWPVLGVPLAELSDRVVELDDLSRPLLREVHERLCETQGDAARVAVIEEVLGAHAGLAVTQDHRVRRTLAALRARPEQSLRALCTDLGVSQKHLIALFHREVGLPPRLLARILRFNAVVREVGPARKVRWADVATRHGYFDQAHLVRDFRAFAGVSPGDYWRRRIAGGAHLAEPPADR